MENIKVAHEIFENEKWLCILYIQSRIGLLVIIDKQTAVKPEEPDIWKILILLNLTHHKRMKLQKKIRALKMKVQTLLQSIMHYSIKDCL